MQWTYYEHRPIEASLISPAVLDRTRALAGRKNQQSKLSTKTKLGEVAMQTYSKQLKRSHPSLLK